MTLVTMKNSLPVFDCSVRFAQNNANVFGCVSQLKLKDVYKEVPEENGE